MAVTSDQVRLSVQAGDDAELDHEFQFKIFSKTDLKCWKVSAAGVYTLGVVDVDYTVAFNAANEAGTVSWIVAPVTGGYSVVAGSEMAFTQGTEFPRDTPIPNSTYRNAFDRVTILIQQLSDTIFGRAIMLEETPVNQTPPTVEAPVASRIVAWNADADALVSTTKTLTTFQDDVDNTAAAAVAAAASQAAAAASAAAALVSENNAETAETAAELAETNAETAETNAAASAAAALVSENNAETAETNAETAETNAETAETGAVAAQAAAEAARDAAVIAQTAAELAETNAETAETNAETAETNAEAAQVAAEAARDATLAAGVTSTSGLFSARPAAPTVVHFYTATDQGNALFLYVPAVGAWITLG